jgi:AcrR family transcriptional regulator
MNAPDKRKQFIEAAYNVFAHKGYSNASIKDVAQEAGVTAGLVHYYFKNKEDLLISVQNEAQRRYQSQYEGWRKDESLTPAKLLQEIKSLASSNPDWYRWRYELYSLALKNDRLKQEAASILRSGRDSLAQPIRQRLTDRPDAADALAGILLACFDGLALQKLLDDEFDLDRAYEVLLEWIPSCLKGEDVP